MAYYIKDHYLNFQNSNFITVDFYYKEFCCLCNKILVWANVKKCVVRSNSI